MEPIKYQLSKRDYVIGLSMVSWRRREFILCEILALIMAFAFWFLESAPEGLAVLFTAISIIFPLVPLYAVNRTVKTNPSAFLSEVTFAADIYGLRTNTVNGSSNLKWSLFKKWSQLGKFIFLQISDRQWLIIPKSAFTNEQLTEFKTLLSEKIRPS
jgi:hypothetical protein